MINEKTLVSNNDIYELYVLLDRLWVVACEQRTEYFEKASGGNIAKRLNILTDKFCYNKTISAIMCEMISECLDIANVLYKKTGEDVE